MKTTRPIAEQRMSDPQGGVRYIPAEPGTRLLSAYLDLNDKAEPVFFESSRVIAWELGIVADSEGDPRCEWSHPITVGEQLRRSQFFGSDRMHAIVFADGPSGTASCARGCAPRSAASPTMSECLASLPRGRVLKKQFDPPLSLSVREGEAEMPEMGKAPTMKRPKQKPTPATVAAAMRLYRPTAPTRRPPPMRLTSKRGRP